MHVVNICHTHSPSDTHDLFAYLHVTVLYREQNLNIFEVFLNRNWNIKRLSTDECAVHQLSVDQVLSYQLLTHAPTLQSFSSSLPNIQGDLCVMFSLVFLPQTINTLDYLLFIIFMLLVISVCWF